MPGKGGAKGARAPRLGEKQPSQQASSTWDRDDWWGEQVVLFQPLPVRFMVWFTVAIGVETEGHDAF